MTSFCFINNYFTIAFWTCDIAITTTGVNEIHCHYQINN